MFVGVVGIASFLVQPIIQAECLILGPDGHGGWRELEDHRFDPPAPIAISGSLCGMARIDRMEPRLAAGLSLKLFDEHDAIVASVRVDAAGSFKFSPLATGRYRLEPEAGLYPSKQVIDFTAVDTNTCDQPLYVTVSVPAECATLTRITTTRPPGF